MKQFLCLCALVGGSILLQFCATSRSAGTAREGDTKKMGITYTADIAPVIQARCTPCHFPNGGKKKFLDTYGAVRDNFDDILYRVQLPADSSAFMPFKSKKEPLSDSLIQVFIAWQNSGMVN